MKKFWTIQAVCLALLLLGAPERAKADTVSGFVILGPGWPSGITPTRCSSGVCDGTGVGQTVNYQLGKNSYARLQIWCQVATCQGTMNVYTSTITNTTSATIPLVLLGSCTNVAQGQGATCSDGSIPLYNVPIAGNFACALTGSVTGTWGCNVETHVVGQ